MIYNLFALMLFISILLMVLCVGGYIADHTKVFDKLIKKMEE